MSKYKFKLNYVISVIIVWTVFCSYLTSQISEDNMIYAIGEINTYDNTLFASNIFMGQGVLSPRFFLDTVFATIMNIDGGSWAITAMSIIYASAIIMAFAIVNIVFSVTEDNQTLYSLCLALLLVLNGNTLAGFSLFALQSLSIGMALALATLGISFVIGKNKKFNLAYICLAFSACCHIHEGLYGFIIICIFCMIDIIQGTKLSLKRQWCILIYIMAVLVIIVPSLLTDKLSISNAEFVKIYSYQRHPHHLIPSSWGINNIFRSLFTILSLASFRIMYLFFIYKQKLKLFLCEAVLFTLAWLGLLGVQYVFTEVFPLAFISTMFISKVFKYIVLISLVWAINTASDFTAYQRYLSSYAVIFYVLMTHNFEGKFLFVFFLIISGVLLLENFCVLRCGNSLLNPLMSGGLFIALICLSIYSEIGIEQKFIVLFATILSMLLKTARHYKRQFLWCGICGLSLGLLLYSLYGDFFWINNGHVILQSEKNLMVSTMGEDLYQLANSFKSYTQKNDVFLADPNDNFGAGWFQVESERNCYIVYKVVPSSKSIMEEWHKRYIATNDLFDKEISEIENIMTSADISYILVNKENYNIFDTSPRFDLFVSCEGDSYRIYQKGE